MGSEDIALFDMDGTLCDYGAGLAVELRRIQSPGEHELILPIPADAPSYLWERVHLITQVPDWWANLPRFELGFDVWRIAAELGFRAMILTQGPKRTPNAWSGKKIWIDRHLGATVDITITRDKGLVYGKLLVDDYPPYIERWLTWRPRGLVIMPANSGNEGFAHPQVIRYDGTNLAQVRAAMGLAKRREPRQPLGLQD